MRHRLPPTTPHFSTRSCRKLALSRLAGLCATTFALAAPSWAQGFNVFVDGSLVNFAGVPPVSQEGRVLVPLRGIFEALGATVDYNAATRTIDALRGQTRLQLTLGSRTAFINGSPTVLDVPAQTQVGRTLVPLRFVGQALGAVVNYNAATREIYITSPGDSGGVDPLPTPRPTPTPTPQLPVGQDPDLDNINLVSGTVVRIDAATRTIIVREEGRNRSFEIARNAVIERRPRLLSSTAGDTRYGTETRLTLDAIEQDEMVELELDAANRVSRLTAMPEIATARIRSATGNRIVLDDARGTTFIIGSQARFINAQGRSVTTANLRAGDEVVLFISPITRRIYQVSASPIDLNAAYGRDVDDTYLPPTDDGYAGDGELPEITQVTHNAREALRAGSVVNVTLRGTPGLRATFDLSTRAVNLPMQERANRPGEYTGNYTVRRGDDVTNSRVTARLIGRDGQEVTQESLDDITIDTEAPRVTDTNPRDGDAVGVAQPNITINAEDLGSGLAPSTITITNNGQQFDVPATVTRRGLRAVSPRNLSGRVDVNAEVRDNAGNVTTETFSFTVGANDTLGAITSINHNVTRALQPGDVIQVNMVAEEGGRATFDLVAENNRVVAQDVPMTEGNRGRYRGSYTVNGTRDMGTLTVIGRFRGADNRLTTREATTTIEVIGSGDLEQVSITTPTEGAAVGEEVTIRGRGLPGAIVEVSVRAEGVQYLVVPYSRELGSTQVRVDRNGAWQTQAIALPRPRNVGSLRYVIRASQTDNANRTSGEVTITVRPR